jgi:hypothetical protein
MVQEEVFLFNVTETFGMQKQPRIVRRTQVIAGLSLSLLWACTSKGAMTPTPTSTRATTPAMAQVVGQLHVAGGPAPGIDKPIPGRIEAHRDTPAGELVSTAEAGEDGSFRMTLSPGSYALVASSPRVVLGRAGVPCGGASTTLHGGENPPLAVYCLIP